MYPNRGIRQLLTEKNKNAYELEIRKAHDISEDTYKRFYCI